MDNKPGTTAFYAFHCNITILAGDDFLRHSQADAHAVAMSVFAAVEPGKQVWEIFTVNAAAAVLYSTARYTGDFQTRKG